MTPRSSRTPNSDGRLPQPDKAVGSFTAAINEWPAHRRRERRIYLYRTAHTHRVSTPDPRPVATVNTSALAAGVAWVRRDVAARARQLESRRGQRDVRHLLDQLAAAR